MSRPDPRLTAAALTALAFLALFWVQFLWWQIPVSLYVLLLMGITLALALISVRTPEGQRPAWATAVVVWGALTMLVVIWVWRVFVGGM